MITLDEQIEWLGKRVKHSMYLKNAYIAAILATLRAVKQAEPVAWLEVHPDGEVLGVSLKRDQESPWNWVPLYAAPAAPQSPKCKHGQSDGECGYCQHDSAVDAVEQSAAPGREG